VSVCYSYLFIAVLLQAFTNAFNRADIHELLAPDLLHQLIKGVFKDHIVEWVTDYIKAKHPKQEANKILDDIDRRSVSQCVTLYGC
jgi:hypothetical protein